MCESTYNTPGKLLQVAHISAHECKYRTCSTFLELKKKNNLQTNEKKYVNELHNTQEKYYILLQDDTVFHNTPG